MKYDPIEKAYTIVAMTLVILGTTLLLLEAVGILPLDY